MSPGESAPVATWYRSGWKRWKLRRSTRVTVTRGSRPSSRAALSPPNPPPTITTRWLAMRRLSRMWRGLSTAGPGERRARRAAGRASGGPGGRRAGRAAGRASGGPGERRARARSVLGSAVDRVVAEAAAAAHLAPDAPRVELATHRNGKQRVAIRLGAREEASVPVVRGPERVDPVRVDSFARQQAVQSSHRSSSMWSAAGGRVATETHKGHAALRASRRPPAEGPDITPTIGGHANPRLPPSPGPGSSVSGARPPLTTSLLPSGRARLERAGRASTGRHPPLFRRRRETTAR